MTENQRAYLDEVRKLKRRVASFEIKGYSFGEDIKKLYELPRNKSGKVYVSKQDIKNISGLKRIELAKQGEYKTISGEKVRGYKAYSEKLHIKERTKPSPEPVYEEPQYDESGYDNYEPEPEPEDIIEKPTIDIVLERIEDLNWATDSDVDYLIRVANDEYDENSEYYNNLVYGEIGKNALSDEDIYEVNVVMKNYFGTWIEIDTHTAHAYYSLLTLRNGNLTDEDMEFLGFLSGVYY